MKMGRLTQWAVIEADVAVRRMSHDQRVSLADEIYAQQPNMLASILVLPQMGVDMAQLEVVLHVLFVTVGADPNLSHRADPILSQGRKPTLRGSAVDKCRSLPGSLSSLSLS